MNEALLQRLEREAEKITLDMPASLDDKEFTSVFNEELVRLVVQECANICINENVSNLDMNVIHNSGKFTIQDLATKSCGENLAKRIKEHFGVE